MSSSSARTFKDGLVIGLIAYTAVVTCYAALDFLAARGAFYTVNVLGQSLFRGLRDPSVLQLPIPLDPMAMFFYNGVHLVASLAIGQAVMAFVDVAEQSPQRSGFAFTMVTAGFVITIVAVGALSAPIRPVLPWWSIVLANSAAVVLAWMYLGARRPGVWRAMTAFAR
ncbi:MAG: hypothetical protein FJ202_11115 [Gemmatimonadetes bacterium]|nr:hypothetical protein [Gemmatimonadota bacterium]